MPCTLGLTAHPDSAEMAAHDRSPQAPHMGTSDLNGGTGGFGRPMVGRRVRTASVLRRPSGGKTVSAVLAR
ncbi:hypothetical protein [Streptomyces niger]|uniref:hypothetical protein n=1 Tax=Streptomyces niger TaxID=66373 RepID=UPI00389AE6FC